jgi:hypothetical protein
MLPLSGKPVAEDRNRTRVHLAIKRKVLAFFCAFLLHFVDAGSHHLTHYGQ